MNRLSYLCACLVLTGCLSPNSSPEAAYYQLQPMELEPEPGRPPFNGLVLEPVEIAGYLDRPQLAVRRNAHRLDYLEYHRWAEPLDENIADVLAANLSALAGPDVPVSTLPTGDRDPPRLRLRVIRFEALPGGEAELEVVYTLAPDGITERLRLATPVEGDSLSDAVAAQSRLLGELARELMRQ